MKWPHTWLQQSVNKHQLFLLHIPDIILVSINFRNERDPQYRSERKSKKKIQIFKWTMKEHCEDH